MDADRFDAAARALGGSRRGLLVSLSGLTFGALAPLLSLADAEAGKKKDKKKGKGKKKKKSNNTCPAGSARCGAGCCAGDLLHYCCKNQSCCKFEQGCSDFGLCSTCDQPSDPCYVANCDHNGNKNPPFVPKCQPEYTCYPVTRPNGPPTGVCHGGCEDNYSVCLQTDGTPFCCHTGAGWTCSGGACKAPPP